jgi:peroxiredoxin
LSRGRAWLKRPHCVSPGRPNPPHWDDIPGAHGSTPEFEGFRDLAADFATLKVKLLGLSQQTTDYQREMAERLSLPFPVLRDNEGRMASALALPTFTTGGEIYLKRLTLIVRAGVIEAVFYPVPKPASHARDVLRWFCGEIPVERS